MYLEDVEYYEHQRELVRNAMDRMKGTDFVTTKIDGEWEDGVIINGVEIPWSIVRAAQNRVYIHDDPCAVYTLPDGSEIEAIEIVEAL